MSHLSESFLSLGTNIEPRLEYLEQALGRLVANDNIHIKVKSSIYETEPIGYVDQGQFLNIVIGIKTSLSALELLDYCQEIEASLGRKRDIRFGPRTIDLDILTYNEEKSEVERLIIPHPRMHERAFVLIPLHEIAPDYIIPVLEKRAEELINELQESDREGVAKWTRE